MSETMCCMSWLHVAIARMHSTTTESSTRVSGFKSCTIATALATESSGLRR
eukprot:CAMPEP_0179871974 /NCGR_PEP_ID=MMETSP0982-20121206/21233_1 /TAXON_ID=483367 /ORGANISM="non described non described, Strain CCMP 2436" /LENGTH=50 /DNA_ID=CAMNT_0021762923 /DNA_START=53 /DNA_END=202 /DNA_ORIENTATION=+